MTDFIGVEWSDQVLAHREVSHVLFEIPGIIPLRKPPLKRLGYTLSDESREIASMTVMFILYLGHGARRTQVVLNDSFKLRKDSWM
ncbi:MULTISPECIES: hypothetical protein [Lonsdalea]|uniref:Uncharacterized protein n=2 Tax=Lonsdalea TaxID=1082702 RepID=A0ACD1JA54_9GAMM|nr:MULTISPECIES: hypothetical protein [Lonsdalea]OSM95083.1 hypothetical protein AU499_15690 [Lonsdalea populi]QPQ23522.1 hypothetical protein I6N93_12930 [Lonsdalea populi]RAT11609.1 hypothetical protein AU485_13980 [Lonsdalea quercina]RAT14697.1 hypothetical protein AU486_12245 [Lonsdalea quercina]RAT18892.1 hypothetical protein AU487_13310 [Lonsdalea populi]